MKTLIILAALFSLQSFAQSSEVNCSVERVNVFGTFMQQYSASATSDSADRAERVACRKALRKCRQELRSGDDCNRV